VTTADESPTRHALRFAERIGVRALVGSWEALSVGTLPGTFYRPCATAGSTFTRWTP